MILRNQTQGNLPRHQRLAIAVGAAPDRHLTRAEPHHPMRLVPRHHGADCLARIANAVDQLLDPQAGRLDHRMGVCLSLVLREIDVVRRQQLGHTITPSVSVIEATV